MRGMKQPKQRYLTASGKLWRAFVTEIVYRILFFEIYKGGLSNRCMGTCKAVLCGLTPRDPSPVSTPLARS